MALLSPFYSCLLCWQWRPGQNLSTAELRQYRLQHKFNKIGSLMPKKETTAGVDQRLSQLHSDRRKELHLHPMQQILLWAPGLHAKAVFSFRSWSQVKIFNNISSPTNSTTKWRNVMQLNTKIPIEFNHQIGKFHHHQWRKTTNLRRGQQNKS